MKKLMITSAIVMTMVAGSAIASQGEVKFFGSVTEATCDVSPVVNGAVNDMIQLVSVKKGLLGEDGFAPIFPDTCYHLTHYWLAAVDIPVASDNPVHYADAIRYNVRTPLQGSLLPLTRLVWA